MAQQFYELQLPELNDDDGKMIWVVRIKDTPAYYLLNDGSYNLDNLMMCADELFCFDSLQEAHHHSFEYYYSHDVAYPYFTEYKALTYDGIEPDAFEEVDNGSQVMTFN